MYVLACLHSEKKKSDFSTDLSSKNRFSGGFEKICTEKNRKKKNRQKIAEISLFFLFVLWLKKYKKIASEGFQNPLKTPGSGTLQPLSH